MRNAIVRMVLRFRALSKVQRGLLCGIAVALCLVLFGQASRPHRQALNPPISEFQTLENSPSTPPSNTEWLETEEKLKDIPNALKESAGSELDLRTRQSTAGTPYATPLMAHTAELVVATHDFGKSRTSLEEIVERHRGYAARLRMAGRRTGSILSATLRVPSAELGSTISELKTLGEVEQEEQAADEITQQRADLDARLANAQGTLRRLQELLKKQTYPDGNVRELQRQIANASAEVNRLEAERDASAHRVIFANVQFSLREVVGAPQETLGAQLHAAAAAGFGEAAASLSAILLFLIGRGPVALLWMVILYFPARLVWRRWVAVPAAGQVAQV